MESVVEVEIHSAVVVVRIGLNIEIEFRDQLLFEASISAQALQVHSLQVSYSVRAIKLTMYWYQ